MLQVVTVAEQCLSCWWTKHWTDAQKTIQRLCTSGVFAQQTVPTAKDDTSASNNIGTSPPSVKTIVSPDDQLALQVGNHGCLGLGELDNQDICDQQRHLGKATQQASIAKVRAVVGSQKAATRNPNVVWQLPGIVSEAQAAILRKIATLVFRLDRQTDIQLVLRVAVSRAV